ncbi:MAG TPA: heavy metal transporter [Chryseosolibacter sp.]
MAKIIRPTYPLEFSIGLLLLIFLLSAFISFEIIDTTWHSIMKGEGPILAMVLCGTVVVILALILWEEFLFPVRLKPMEDEIVFRNHFTKLRSQVFIYLLIPVLIAVVYAMYDVHPVAFSIWAAICIFTPAGKLFSGIKNYNDFLKFTDHTIEYRNNDKEGILLVKDIHEMQLIRDEAQVVHKVKVIMSDGKYVLIDLDEMELEAYLQTIESFIKNHYGILVKEPSFNQ